MNFRLRCAVAVILAGSQAVAVAAESTVVLEEIQVTATRRTTNLMKTPESIVAFTAEDIQNANIVRTKDFLFLTSNVSMGENRAGEAWISIRGLTNFRFGDPSVAYLVDGIQILDADGFNRDVFDVERIEVLKGPQGGLYGRNAVGGAVVIETVKPSDEPDGWIEAGYGNDNTYTYRGAFGGPLLAETLSGRVSVSSRSTDGTFTNINTGAHMHQYEDLSAYGVLRFTPNERTTIDLRYGNTSIEGAGTAFVAQLAAEGYDANDATRPFESDMKGFQGQDITTASLKADVNFSGFDLVYGLGYYDMDRHYSIGTIPYRYFPLGSAQYQYRRFESLSHDLRLTSNRDAAIGWMLGVFYADIDTRTANVVTSRPVGLSPPALRVWEPTSPWPTLAYADDDGTSDAYAVYGSLTYDFTDALSAMVALRYDSETRERTNNAFGWSPTAGETVKKTWSELQPKASLKYSFAEDQMVYVTAGRGFKSGGFNPSGTEERMQQFNPNSSIKDIVDASVVDSVELGYKATLLDSRLRLSLAAFYQTIENAQSFEYNLAFAFNGISTAKEGTVTGFEADLQWLLAEGLQVFAAFGYQDSELTEFPDEPALEGNWLPNVPKTTGNLGFQWEAPIGGTWRATTRVNVRHEGERYFNWPNTPGTKRDSVELLDARVAFGTDRFTVALWGKNLTDELYFDDYVPVIPVAGAAYKAPLRTYGVEAKYSF